MNLASLARPSFPGLRRVWGRVRSKIAAIIILTGGSTILMALLAVAALNVMVRRESANVVVKQIQVLVQASRSVARAILDQAGACTSRPANARGLTPLLAYTDEAFPRARASLTVDDRNGSMSLLPGREPAAITQPAWLPKAGFAGLVVDRGQLEIRNVVVQENGTCRATAIFRLPLGSELARRLSSAAGMEVTRVSPTPFLVHSPMQHVLTTIGGNFLPGVSRPASVVLTVRNWETGAQEDWIAYTARANYSHTFGDVAQLGRQLAAWVWLLAALSLTVLLLEATGVWVSIRLGRQITATINDLTSAARQIAGRNFAWRAPVRSSGQLGELMENFNDMAVDLERLQKEETARLQLDAELQVARRVQEYLFPRVAPVLRGATVAGRTVAARMIGGDLYDFFDLGRQRAGILCADVSGKGVAAALMMANLQAIARAHLGGGPGTPGMPPADFVGVLNQELAGRFGDNRYATVFWAVYNADTNMLAYVNAGHPSAILTHSTGEIERLSSDGFPSGMFANAQYTDRTVRMRAGSRLVIFTDGLTDAQNSAGEEFGDERLLEYCKHIPAGLDAATVADRLMQIGAEWASATEQFDDTTVVVLDVDG